MKQLKLNQFLNYTYLSNISKSKNETYVSFVAAKARVKQNDYTHDLYISNGKKHRKMLNLKQDSRIVWESDSTLLYFTEKTKIDKKLKEQKNTIVYRFNVETKKSELAYTFPFPVGSIQVVSREKLLLRASLNEQEHVYFADAHLRKEYIDECKRNSAYQVIDTVPFQSNGGSFTDGRISQAFIYTIENGEYTALSDKHESIGSIAFNENKTVLYYTVSENFQVPNFMDCIKSIQVDTLKVEHVLSKPQYSVSNLFVLADQVYMFGSDLKSNGINQNGDFYKIENNEAKLVLKFGKSSYNSVGSDVRYGGQSLSTVENDTYYFVGSDRMNTTLYAFDGNTLKKHHSYESSLDGFVFKGEELLSIQLKSDKLQEVYNNETCVSKFNELVLLDSFVSNPIHHEFVNDNQILDGWVLLPDGYDDTKQYPSILNIHGGPKTIYSNVFYHEMQVWVNEGYIVYFMNPRGGDSYDDAFADIRGKYGTIDFDDLMAFTDLIEKEYALDTNRMGVTGGSYGGFMTNWIVSHTNRFKAAATQRSISNWISFYGTSDIGVYFAPDQTGADPLNDTEKAWEQSPLKHADSIVTPLLFIHSDADYRCPIEQAMQLYSRVKMNGVDTRFVWFKGENHDLSRSGKPNARVRRLEEITNWMNLHLK